MKLSRRNFAKLCGTSAALAGLGVGVRARPAGAEAAAEMAAIPLPAKLERELARRLLHAKDPLAAKTVPIAENMEPGIPHPEQEAEVKQKLAGLERKSGK
jgi:hypothetical protein